MNIIKNNYLFLLLSLAIACNNKPTKLSSDSKTVKGSYGYDAAFLKKYSSHTIELENGNAKVLLSANY